MCGRGEDVEERVDGGVAGGVDGDVVCGEEAGTYVEWVSVDWGLGFSGEAGEGFEEGARRLVVIVVVGGSGEEGFLDFGLDGFDACAVPLVETTGFEACEKGFKDLWDQADSCCGGGDAADEGSCVGHEFVVAGERVAVEDAGVGLDEDLLHGSLQADCCPVLGVLAPERVDGGFDLVLELRNAGFDSDFVDCFDVEGLGELVRCWRCPSELSRFRD